MSLHPVKRSDKDKDWNRGRKTKCIPIQPEYQLIVTEGTRTEPSYFKAIADIVNSRYPNKINVQVEGVGNNTLNLLEKAKRLAEGSGNEIKHVWLVFDTDDFPQENINKTVELCGNYSSDGIEYHAIWSNQCIELWFLLHFGYYQTDIHRKEYFPKLSEYLIAGGHGEYAKNRPDMFNILQPYTSTAVMYAQKLERANTGKTPADSAPGTMVHHLILSLSPYMK